MDKIVLDIETKNAFADVGGQQNLHKLDVSFVGVYSYKTNSYLSFFENELDKLSPILQNAGLIIGFASNRFDIPLLNKYYNFNLEKIESLDILDDIESRLGHRIGLDQLAQTNLKIGKTHHGLEAIKLYKEGNLEELKNYCLNDVKITKDLYELGKKQGHLLVPTDHGNNIVKVEFNWHERLPLQNLF
ncbi:MAG: ribonuclease H-like domain-containing protein [Candidatus Pacebacteria bacterium]|nr:ribonuclease H-like domain-containing protein [Candidatus Paceibacterota bacterium]